MDKFSDISSDEQNKSISDKHEDVVKLFDSENEIDESFSGFDDSDAAGNKKEKQNIKPRRSRARKGTGKGPGKNTKGKAPMKRKSEVHVVQKPKSGSDINNNLNYDILAQLVSNYFNNQSGVAGDDMPSTSKAYVAPPRMENDQQDFSDANLCDTDPQPLNVNSLFSNHDINDQFILNSDEQGFVMPRIFEDQIKFSEAVSETSADFVKSACTQKADISALLKDTQIPVNCKSLVPPLINPEIWSCLYSNIQQRDRSMQDIQKILGLAIVPLIQLTEMFKTRRIDLSKAKDFLAHALALTCNTFFELNIKRRYFIRPYVNKRFQQLCSSTCPIGEQLFPNDVGKRMKEISDASNINRQLRPKNSRGRPSLRAGFQPYQTQHAQWSQNQRGRGYQRRPRGGMRGKFYNHS